MPSNRPAANSPDLFTSSEFHNTGIPKNPTIPTTSKPTKLPIPKAITRSEPTSLTMAWAISSTGNSNFPPAIRIGKQRQGDYLESTAPSKPQPFATPTPGPIADFVKCYGHNGFFKSLPQIVHFYNTRNLTTQAGEVINFTMANPYAHLKGKPIWPPPENLSPQTLVNPIGRQA